MEISFSALISVAVGLPEWAAAAEEWGIEMTWSQARPMKTLMVVR